MLEASREDLRQREIVEQEWLLVEGRVAAAIARKQAFLQAAA